MSSQPKNSITEKLNLAREDWDFSCVPDNELESCFLWECAREWDDIGTAFKAIPYPFVPSEANYEALREETNVRNIDQIWEIYLANSQMDLKRAWQNFSAMDRAEIVERNNPGLRRISSKALREYECTKVSDDNEFIFDKVAFEINWHESDNQLLSEFAQWLKNHRIRRPRENRGSNTRDRLKMFGAMRLLHHYSFDAATRVSTNVLGAPLYGKRPSWERARKGALDAYRTHFFDDWGSFLSPPVPKSFPKYNGPLQMIASSHPDGL